ncbi:MAG: hypothetical protein ABJI69_16220 [Balneola sp.]
MIYQIVALIVLLTYLLVIIIRHKNIYSLLYYLVPISLLFDIFVNHFADGGLSLIAALRVLFTYSLVLYLVLKRPEKSIFSFTLLIYFLYTFILVLVRDFDDLFGNIEYLLKLNMSMIFVYICYSYFKKIKHLNILSNQLFFSLLIFLAYLLIANIFNLGSLYVEDPEEMDIGVINTGALVGNNFYSLAYLIILFPFVKKYSDYASNKLFNLVYIVAAITVLLPFRRTAILILAFGILLYFLINLSKIKKTLKYGLLLSFILLSSSPLYLPYLDAARAVRGVRGENPFAAQTIQQESRFLEVFEVSDRLYEEGLNGILFGKSFDIVGVYPPGSNRPLHSDFTILLYTSGLIGFALYLLIYISFFWVFIKNKTFKKNRLFDYIFLSMFFISLLVSYPGRFTSITHRSIVFIMIGVSLAVMKVNKQSLEGNK